MANLSIARKLTRMYEGGYSPGFTGSGETYAGIDRTYGSPNWPGWKIIDRIPNKYPKQVFNNPQLDKLVENYYAGRWAGSGIAAIKEQTLANMLWDFYFHKPAIAIAAANTTALQLDEEATTSSNKLTDDVLQLMNDKPQEMYSGIYKLRIRHYNNTWMNRIGKTLIKYTTTKKGLLARARKFPAPENFMPQVNNNYGFIDAYNILL